MKRILAIVLLLAAHAFAQGTGGGQSGTGGSGGTLPISSVLSATGPIATIADGNNPLTINCAITSNTVGCVNFGETVAASGGSNNAEVGISTLGNSDAVPLNIAQGANTGTGNVSAVNITETWNNASLSGILIKAALTNTSSVATSFLMELLAGAGAATEEFGVTVAGAVQAGTGYEGTAINNNTAVCGGLCTAAANGVAGALSAQGSDNSNNGAAVGGGAGIFRGGMLTNATPSGTALEGVTQVGYGYLKGSAVANVGDVVCGTTTAFTVTDCGLAAVNIVGIATSTTNPIGVVAEGTVLVKFDGAVTLGDTACGPPVSTGTAGLAHDSGGTAACPLGAAIGIIVADVGTITQMSGATTASTAMSTTLALVQLHISQ